ncbi:MAG: hypothetical protein L0H79_01240 [Intrasporangium sp.]|uniref:hypothetical protein n=1 Tax=Intrasporangium sp. TaxID=1925024 RepID=UPI002648D108|nr:hypothetical protein [Intrasporangium sp.]MDN5794359.1 hypothetical protein [Intrasporangium sp.]
MARKGKVLTTVVVLGVKYGPQIWVAGKALREPAKEAAQKIMASEQARRAAYAHAHTIWEGSILKVYRGEQAHWVVFTGDTAVTVHPMADVPLGDLILGVDLTRRIRTDERVSAKARVKDHAATALRRGH